MRRLIIFIKRQSLGAASLALILGGVAYSRTGDPLRLGLVNKANQPTIVENTDVGPALELRTRRGQPPLRVNSTRLVPRLNAAKLGGRAPGAFALKSAVYSRGESDARYGSLDGSRVLLVVSHLESDGGQREFIKRTVTAPGNGRISIVATGQVIAPGGFLQVEVGSSIKVGFCHSGATSCSVAVGAAVSKGATVSLRAVWDDNLYPGGRFNGAAFVLFEPS